MCDFVPDRGGTDAHVPALRSESTDDSVDYHSLRVEGGGGGRRLAVVGKSSHPTEGVDVWYNETAS